MTIERYFEAEGDEREAYLGSQTPEALLRLGADLYNAGYYWNAHEAWEEVWLEADRGLRNFYQGLIQVSAAFVHITNNRYPGGVRLLSSGIAKLENYRPATLGVELSTFLEEAKAARDQVVALGENGLRQFDRALIPRLHVQAEAPTEC